MAGKGEKTSAGITRTEIAPANNNFSDEASLPRKATLLQLLKEHGDMQCRMAEMHAEMQRQQGDLQRRIILLAGE